VSRRHVMYTCINMYTYVYNVDVYVCVYVCVYMRSTAVRDNFDVCVCVCVCVCEGMKMRVCVWV